MYVPPTHIYPNAYAKLKLTYLGNIRITPLVVMAMNIEAIAVTFQCTKTAGHLLFDL